MPTTAELRAQTKAAILSIAKNLGASTKSSMTKDELIAVVVKAQRSAQRKAAKKDGPKSRGTAQSASKARSTKAAPKAKKSASPRSESKARRVSAKATGGNTSAKSRGAAKTVAADSDSRPRAAASRKPATKSKTSKLDSGPAAKPKKVVAKKAVKEKPKTNPRILKQIREVQLQKKASRDIGFRPTLVRPPGAAEAIWEKEPQKDRVALFVRDAYWMHATWDVTRSAIDRARASMAEQWHAAKPVLRLLRLDDSGKSSASETVERDIEIHGGLRNWYIDWTGEAARFRVLVGYLAANGKFHAIAESNSVNTPDAGAVDSVDENWADSGSDSERIFSLSGGYDKEQETAEMRDMLEDRLHRELGAPALAKLGAGVGADAPFRRRGSFHFHMDIELVVYGSTMPDSYLTLSGEPVSLRPDGTFVMRLPFPDRRQVLPAVAVSRDGSQQRTIVVAVERNTKIMEPLESERDTGE